ncbi:GAF domain-containing protein [Thermodesulfobacteriota bacterium]
MPLKQYIQLARLDLDMDELAVPVADFIKKYRKIAAENIPPKHEASLYSYEVPGLSPDGSCAIPDASDPEHYDLSEILGGRNPDTTNQLARLNALVTRIAEAMSVDWLGIYQRRTKQDGSDVLVKLAYYGAKSRAEFPLNEAFAAQSNNSTVGLTGKGRIINNIPKYINSGGPYYSCDPRVKAEACLPLFSRDPKAVVGIVDSEAWHTDFFSTKTLAPLLALCIVAPEFLI